MEWDWPTVIRLIALIIGGGGAVITFKLGMILWKNDPNNPLIAEARRWKEKEPERRALQQWINAASE